MGQFLQVNGDYNIKTGEGARITLDTGLPASGGEVRVTGNLIVEGITVSVAATNLDLTDNIITLNSGETFEGVFKDYSGFEIDRGFYADSSAVPRSVLLYAEPNDLVDIEDADPRPTWLIANNSAPGPFNFDESNLKLRRILTDSLTDSGDLILIGSGTGVVKVIGTANYEDQVTHDDDLPNKKYVDTAIQIQPTFQIVAPTEDTRVIVVDKDIASGFGSESYLSSLPGTYDTDGESAVSFIIDGDLVAQIYQDRVLFGRNGLNGLIIDGPNYEIRTEPQVRDQNIYVITDGTGKLQTNYALQLDKISSPGPNYVSGSTVVYGRTPALGDSGVWYVNDNLQVNKRQGELVSKNRALLFGMIF